jgi:hypothetical protein
VHRVLAILALLALTACGGTGYSIPEPDPLPSLPATTAAPDFSNIALAGVPGRTTTTIVLGPGRAGLKGTVAGPDGLIPGATVRIERLVGDAVAAAEVFTGPDGAWTAPGVLGGRYRVRAWRVPDLALTKPVVFFLGADEQRPVDLLVNRYSGTAVSGSMAPSPPLLDEPANLVVRVAQQSVDPTGVVRAAPISGVMVELVGSGDWRVDTENPSFTDFNGDVGWQVRCRSAGSQPLGVLVNGEAFPLTLPACQEAFVEPPSDDGPPGSTESPTTARRPTTTVRRPTTTRPA